MGRYIHDSGQRQEGMFRTCFLHGTGRYTNSWGAVFEGEFNEDNLHGDNCKKLTSEGDLTIGTYFNGILDESKPYFEIQKIPSGRIYMYYRSPHTGRTTFGRTELFNWLYTAGGKLEGIKEDIGDDIKQYIRNHLAWVIYEGNPVKLGVYKSGEISDLMINRNSYTDTLQNYLLTGRGKVIYYWDITDEGLFRYGLLTHGVRVAPWGGGDYSIDILLQEGDSKQIKEIYHYFGKYDDVTNKLEQTTKDLEKKENTNEKQEKIQLVKQAKKTLKGVKERQEAAKAKTRQ
jgi:hypothetical protein